MERLNNPFEYKEFKYLFGHYSSEEKYGIFSREDLFY